MLHTKPFFSIITCTYNSKKYISKNIDSVNKQTLQDYEQIIVDGNSSDDTVKIIRKSIKNDKSKIRIYLQKPNGVAAAFNYGIEKSKGKYIIFLNSDDAFFDNNVLKDVHTFLTKNKNLDWLYGKINVILPNSNSIGIFPNRKIFQISNRFLLKFINYIPHQAVFMRRDIFAKYGLFDESLKTSMDYEYYLRISHKTSWCFFDRIVSNFMVRADAVSSSLENREGNFEAFRFVQKKYLNLVELSVARVVNPLINMFNIVYKNQV